MGGKINQKQISKTGVRKTALNASQQASVALELSTRVAEQYNNSVKRFDARLTNVEKSIVHLVDTNAILHRKAARTMGFDWSTLQADQLELNLIKDFTALLHYISKHIDENSPLLVFDAITEIPQKQPVEKPFHLLLAFDTPGQGLTLTMETNGNISFRDFMVVVDDNEESTGVYISADAFRPWVMGESSTEILFMQGLLGTDDNTGVARWLSNVHFESYVKKILQEQLSQTQVRQVKLDEDDGDGMEIDAGLELDEEDTVEELAEQPDRIEATPEDFAVTGHPPNARIFGGDFVPTEQPSTDPQTEDEEHSHE